MEKLKILLAIDDSRFSEAAVQMVASQCRPESTEVRVLHILEPITALFPAMNYQPLDSPTWDRLQKESSARGHDLVAKATERLRAAGFHADAMVREGITRPDIVDIAAEWGADLIMLGAHGRRGLERLLLGSVSDFVARHAKCSVEIVRMPAIKRSEP
jgi:nucleotide-binding universal stress UspA family protein